MLLALIALNPLDNDLFWPTVVRLAALLAVGALTVALVERKPLSELRETVLFQRVFSWSVMGPLYVLSVFSGGVVALIVLGYVIVQSAAEYARLVGLQRRYGWFLVLSGVLTLSLTGFLSRYFLYAPLTFLALITLMPIVTGRVENAHYQVTSSVFGYVYVCFALSYLAFIRVVEPTGVRMLLFIGVAVALSDVSAFIAGKVLGGPKLAPRVSPNKTWAGAVGNLVGAYVALALMWYAIPEAWSTATRVLVPFLLGVAALWGDLIESLVKRDFGVKDAGELLPGFGGLLDRVDSLLIALPLSYYAIVVIQHYTI